MHTRYKAGKSLGNADALSRLPQPVTTSSDRPPADLVHLVDHLADTAISSANIKTWTSRDPVLAKVRKYVMEGWPRYELDEELKTYRSRSKELSVYDGCVLWGSRVR